MAEDLKPVDLFVSGGSDAQELVGEIVAECLRQGVTPYRSPVGAEDDKPILEALRECVALALAVASDRLSPQSLLELGAVQGYYKPTFVVLGSPGLRFSESFGFGGHRILSRNRIEEAVAAVRRMTAELTDDDREALVETYQEFGLSADRLIVETKLGDEFVAAFERRAGKRFRSDRLFAELLRMRKQNRLPRLRRTKRTASAAAAASDDL